jgi:hypothetical protein
MRPFVTDTGLLVTPYLRAGFDYYAGANSGAVALTAADGTLFSSGFVRLDRAAAVLGGGLTLDQGNWSMFANYDAHIAGNWNTQEVKLGFRVKF